MQFHRDRRCSAHLALLCALALAVPRAPVLAWQDAAPSPEGAATDRSPGPGEAQPLTERQALVRDRVTRLEDRMFQLHEALRKNEPEKAQKLLSTLGASRSMLVRQKIDEIIAALKSGQYSDARDQQEAVARDLQTLLKYLLEEPDDSAARKHEMERLHAARESLERVIKDQQRELEQAQAAAEAQARSAALQVAKRSLQELAERQAELRAQAQTGAISRETAAARQRSLADDTTKQATALHDLPRTDASPATQAGQAAQQAADAMKQAGERLDQSDAPGATQAQELAEASLKEAIEQIDKQLRDDARTPTPRDQADDQEKTARETEQLGGEMKTADPKPAQPGSPDSSEEPSDSDKPDGQSPPGSGSPKNSSGDESGQPNQEMGDNKPLPGQQEVENAVPLQREAADELRKEKPKDAAEKQTEALKKLKAARDLLNATLEQLRKEQQETLLAALETRFAAMLAKQLDCNKATVALHELGRANWKRTDQLALADLAAGQQWISQEADQALTILKEEGTTVAFPQIVSQIRDDSRVAGDHLAAANVSELTQGLQKAIEEALRELLDAVKKKQEELQSAPDESDGSQSQDQNPPLLPGSAELKLLRSCQMRINSATTRLDGLRTTEQNAMGLVEELKRLAERQKQVSDMAKQMHESLTRTQ